MPERTLRRKAARFATTACAACSTQPAPAAGDRRALAEIRQAIVELKAEYPPLRPTRSPRICRERFDRPVSHHTVKQVLADEPLPVASAAALPALPRDPRSRSQRRLAVVALYLEGWSVTAIAGYLATSRATVYETLRALGRRRAGRGWPTGPRARSTRPRKVDLRAMAAIRRLQANPELGEFRIHAALAQQGIHLSPAHLRPHPGPAPRARRAAAGRGTAARAAADAVRRRSAGTSTGRSISATSRTTASATGKPVYVDLDPGELQPRHPGQRHLARART